MKLIKLKVVETTNEGIIFRIKIKTFFGTKSFDCFRRNFSTRSIFLSDGTCVYIRYLNLDESINAILSSDNKEYTENTLI